MTGKICAHLYFYTVLFNFPQIFLMQLSESLPLLPPCGTEQNAHDNTFLTIYIKRAVQPIRTGSFIRPNRNTTYSACPVYHFRTAGRRHRNHKRIFGFAFFTISIMFSLCCSVHFDLFLSATKRDCCPEHYMKIQINDLTTPPIEKARSRRACPSIENTKSS